MADALLSAVVNPILETINSLCLEELGIIGALKTELESLQSTLSTIQAVLLDAEEKQWESEAIKNWLGKLKDAAYHLDDILDEFATSTQRGRLQTDARSQVNTFFSLPKQLLSRVTMAHKLKNVREKLDLIAGERSKFHLREGMEPMEDRHVCDREGRQTSSLVNVSEVYGRDKELEKFMNMLLNNLGDQDGISVYTICGMGGLGKTTLAQLVYNHESIAKAFDLKIWVCVSDDFDITRLTRAIIESIEGRCSIQELDPLQRHLQEKLIGKRFLLVLDDVWNEYHERWKTLKEAFRCGAQGSAVIVTTRSEKVARMMTTTPEFPLGCLSFDDSWALFKQRAFRMGKSEDYPRLEAHGREIVKKCGGVPLAINALGSLLRFKEGESEWLSIKESKMWELPDDGERVFSLLSLSYRHLRPHLRQCFTFCSIFPKDFIMKKGQLVQLWMANGFVPLKGQMNLHDLGSEIFNELAWRSFFQEVKEDRYGNVTCKMHDLMHDLAQSIMKYECYMIDPSGVLAIPIPKRARHISCFDYSSDVVLSNVDNLPNLRSLIVPEKFCSRIVAKAKHLRVLRLCSHRALKNAIAHCKQLRYLDLSGSTIETLPESISGFHNLQTLRLRNCFRLRMLPKGMKHLKNLIYLDTRGCHQLRMLPEGMKHLKNLIYLDITGFDGLTCMPVGLGQLSYLRKLSMFIVGKGNGCGIDELKGLALEGDLWIKELDHVKGLLEASSANLMMKQGLRSLTLSWREDNDGSPHDDAEEDVLSGLQPHSSLKKLSIENYHGPRFSNWMMDLLVPNLVEISLENCERCEWLPPLGKLRFLKVLTIRRMNLKSIDGRFYGDGESSFPSLQSLCFENMPCLEEWTTTNGRENFPLLDSLDLWDCPKLVEVPMIPSLKRLKIHGNNVMLLRSLVNFTSLTSLKIGFMDELVVLPDGMLQNHKHLEQLEINFAKSLKSLSNHQLDNLSALKCLTLVSCENLESLPAELENLESLERLYLYGCHSLVSLPASGLRGLRSLSQLYISCCKNVASLPEEVRHLTSLQDLSIDECPSLKSLPESIQHLSALRSLKIHVCDGLTSLPNGMQSLTALKNLEIIHCPHLEKRYEKGRGEGWPNIAHIPSIHITSVARHRSRGRVLRRAYDWTRGMSRKLFRAS